jgi:drug/metabolite transporter (DMT)-like permease
MRQFLSNVTLLACAALLFMVASAALSFVTGKWHWFGRSGAVATIAGVVLTVRPLIRMGMEQWLQHLSTIDGGHVIPTSEEIEAGRQAALDVKATKWGVVLAVGGTLVWAYGDLIGGLP